MAERRIYPLRRSFPGIAGAWAALPGSPVTEIAGVCAQPLKTDANGRPRPAANDISNPCLSCGACCSHFRVSFYCGEVADERGGTVPPELVTQVGPLRACMKGTEDGGRCIALRGELGQDGIHCAIYEQRSTPCRDFPTWLEDGSPNPDCQRLRATLGLPPLPRLPDGGHPANTPPSHDVAA